MNTYRRLCTEFYDLDKPAAPPDVLHCYLRYAEEARGPILEPMCGSGRLLIPFLEKGYDVTGFDYSPYMLDECRKKCRKLGLTPSVHEAAFETFSLPGTYNLIFIPSGSFCLLTTPGQVASALEFISARLNPGGKFVFEIETLKAAGQSPGVWRGKWVDRPNGGKIVHSSLCRFDPQSRIETILCRYELWEGNEVLLTEVEDLQLRLYEPAELEALLAQHGFKVLGKWQAEPHLPKEADADAPVILYECSKLRMQNSN